MVVVTTKLIKSKKPMTKIKAKLLALSVTIRKKLKLDVLSTFQIWFRNW
jgi:hypothetical protein